MKSCFFIIILIVLFADKYFPQAVDIPFTATDGSCPPFPLNIGLDLTATNCIDPQLGECELPYPSPGYFDIRFDLTPYGCEGVTTYKDYRAPGDPPAFPFTGMIQHKLAWQKSAPDLPVDITFDLPPGALMTITDDFGGIILNLGPFIGEDSVTIPDPFYKVLINMYYTNIGVDPTPEPVFFLIPSSLNFGELAFGDSSTLPVWVSNVGYIDSLFIYNIMSSDPSFTFEPNTFPIKLAPGQTQNFNITYSGITGGTHIDSLLFLHNAPDSPGILNLSASTFEPNSNCEAQMFWEIIVSDGVASPRHLFFGLDSTATDSIDPQLGEIGPLPPFPPPEVFESQFFLPENNFLGTLSSYCDFRYADLPYSDQKEWRLAYQPGTGNTITISWGFTSDISGVLQDVINGTFINVPMNDSGSYTVENPILFNKLRMLIDFNITTPVEFSSFTLELKGEAVVLEWETASEKNNRGFELERGQRSEIRDQRSEIGSQKVEESEWVKIGYVAGSGTTTEPKTYSFTDENVSSGIYKYRLKQIDFDGSFKYSEEIEVEVNFIPAKFTLEQNYPNPFNPMTRIRFGLPEATDVSLIIYNSLGQKVTELVNSKLEAGSYEYQWNAKDFASGIYIYELRTEKFVAIKKMLLLK